MKNEPIIFRPHSEKQEIALFSQKKFVICGTGIQWGKTRIGAYKMKMMIHTYTNTNDHFLILAPTYKIMRQSTLPAFLEIMEGCGEYKSTESIFYVHGGGKVFIRSTTDPDAMVGITNVRFCWADEAGIMSLYAFENMQARCSFMKAPIILTTSPYSLNWVYKDLIRPFKKGLRDDVELIQATSAENPYFPADEFEERQKTMDPRRFRMIYGGEFERPEGLVYDCFNNETNMVRPFDLPSGTKFYGGVDWGYRDPFVLIIRAITPDNYYYDISEVYRPGLTMSQIKVIVRMKHEIFNFERIFADPSRPDCIAELCPVVPCVAADNDIKKGVGLHYELIKSGRYKVFDGKCPHMIDEIESYHYPSEPDLKPDQHEKDLNLPVDAGNHAMDCCRYLTIMTYRKEHKNLPKVAGIESKPMTIDKRIEMLKRKPKHSAQTEEWCA